MPTQERVRSFIETVEANKFVEALRDFYTDDATMQENNDPPRGGLPVLIAGEEQVLAAFKTVRTEPGSSYLIDGDQVVVNWTFLFTNADGKTVRFEELALQTWSGDRIMRERFFYDPAQRSVYVNEAA